MKTRTIARGLRNPESYQPMLAIRTESEYDEKLEQLNQLVDLIGDHPEDPRYRLVETLTVLIAAYDAEHYKLPDATEIEMLKFLMEQHDLSQSQLPEIGTQGVVSEILCGKRKLNRRQIEGLSQRFHVSPAVFFAASEE